MVLYLSRCNPTQLQFDKHLLFYIYLKLRTNKILKISINHILIAGYGLRQNILSRMFFNTFRVRVLLQQVELDVKNVWCHDTEALWHGAVPDNCNIDTKVWRPALLSSHQIMVHIVIGQWQEFCFVQDIPRIMLDTIDNMWYIFNQWLPAQLKIS